MPRSGKDARRRLQGAALELWSERGYDRTTTAEIAARAGVTERTFFRHFPDKREVLFDGEDRLQTAVVQVIAEAPPGMKPMETLKLAFDAAAAIFEQNRAFSEPRQRVIVATPALQEREAGKTVAMMSALAAALEQRGVEWETATLTVQLCGAAFNIALAAWLSDASDGLNAHLKRALQKVRMLSLEL